MAAEIDKGSAQLILLKEINEAANRGEDLSGILQSAVEGVAEIFNYPACDIFLLEEPDVLRYANITIDSKIMRAAEKLTGITVDGYKIKLFEGSCFKEVIDTKAPVILDDMVRVFEAFSGGDPRLVKLAPIVAKIAGFKWVIRVPLLSNNSVLGILGAATNKNMSDVDIPSLELFASNLAGIIERKQMEDALRESEEKYKLIVNSSHTGIYILQEGKVQFVNQRLSEITGYTQEELIGMSFESLIAPESKEVIAESYARQKGKSGPAYVEFKGLRKDETRRDAITYSVPIMFKGRPAVQGNLIDITERKKAEEALQKAHDELELRVEERTAELKASEIKYSTLVEQGNDGIVIIQEGVLKFINPMVSEITGFPIDEVIGMAFLDFIAPEYRDLVLERYKKRMSGEDVPSRYEIELLSNDGGKIPVEVSASVIEYEQQPADMGIIRDITERKEAELALKDINEKMNSVFQGSPDFIVGLDVEANITFINRPMEGFPIKDLIGRSLYDFNDEKNSEILRKCFARVLKTGENDSYEIKFAHPNGSIFYFEGTVAPVHRGKKVNGLLVNARDITARKNAEEEIKLFKLLSDHSNDPHYLVDREAHIVYANKVACEKLNYTQEEILKKSVTDLDTVYDKSKFQELFDLVQKENVPRFESVNKRKDGSTFSSEFSVIGVRSQKTPYLFAAARDITERKIAEEELAKHRNHLEELIVDRTKDLMDARDSLIGLLEENKESNKMLEAANIRLLENDRLKSVFLATVSHELRTPLNSIIGFTGLMLQGLVGELDSEQKKQLEIVSTNARHLLALIEDLLDISIIEAGRIDVEAAEFNLQEAVCDVIELFTPKTEEKGLRIIENTSKIVVRSDVKRFKQVLTNLVDNAVKFTFEGEIRVSAYQEGGNIVVSVEDTGIGIKAEDMPLLFQSFHRVKPAVDSVTEGSGLGLYLCKKIADILGGEITVESTYQKGSTFTLTIPADLSQSVR